MHRDRDVTRPRHVGIDAQLELPGPDVRRREPVHPDVAVSIGAVELSGQGGERAGDVGWAAGDVAPWGAAQRQRSGDLCGELLADPGVLLSVAGRGVRVGVEPLVSLEGHPGQQCIVQDLFERVGHADVSVELQHPHVPLRGRDHAAALRVRAGQGQLVGLADRFGGPPAADGTGDVRGGGVELVPPSAHRVGTRRVARFDREVGEPAGEVQHAHRVPPQAVPVLPRDLIAEEHGKIEVPCGAGLPIQLDQRHLHDGMPITRLAGPGRHAGDQDLRSARPRRACPRGLVHVHARSRPG